MRKKFYIILLGFLIFTSACQKFSEGITGTKRSKASDEFLIQKKSPLVLPPDYESMPLPKVDQEKKKDTGSIEDLLEISKSESQENNNIEGESLEEIILKKLKKKTNDN
tara:strand:- start:165 stop:491 length:327 start_codon:yes stop_codon:yes gene_type:complete